MFSGLLLAAEGRKSALYPRLKETRLYGAKGNRHGLAMATGAKVPIQLGRSFFRAGIQPLD
jgi:hypothetical protein